MPSRYLMRCESPLCDYSAERHLNAKRCPKCGGKLTRFPKCKGCSQSNWYGDKYHGYCLDCWNAGRYELDAALKTAAAALRRSLAEWREALTTGGLRRDLQESALVAIAQLKAALKAIGEKEATP